ncbi:8247_t:CDS:2 [Paraglomus occultum]|uniref:8247_t:CDS:1 n=1 Tax=Paraglomus occultum TaxID=144539 RepID=A0A9N9AJQ6_9GLOM|nr:8247_t:CDS:2 [Paraglomus occultum]
MLVTSQLESKNGDGWQSSSNILIKSGVAKITDFGLSNVLKQAISKSSDKGALAYKDPLFLVNTSYQLDKKSDIFSLGVIFWEISSGEVPCSGHTEMNYIVTYRRNGFRDLTFPGTPEEYFKLYSECWTGDRSKRPDCEKVSFNYSNKTLFDKLPMYYVDI